MIIVKKAELSVTGVLIFFFLAGCGTIGRNFDDSQIKSIQNKTTNQSVIIDKFGLPFKEGNENGQTMWTYQFDKWNIFGPDKSKDLVILFDKKNNVSTYRYTTSELE